MATPPEQSAGAARATASALFPPGVEVVEATPEMYEAPLTAEEYAAIARAVASRSRQFRAGRACAREALRRIGQEVESIPVTEGGRSPVWPPGVVGAITHCAGYCAAAVAREDELGAVGLDGEERRRVSEKVANAICTGAELERLGQLGDLCEWATLVFSAKEAGYKCLGPLTGLWIGFQEAEVEFDPGSPKLTIRMVRGALEGLVFAGRYALEDGVVLTAATLSPEDAGRVRALAGRKR